jgi:enoyl-CoA hydratase/carnithine racemase
MTFETIRYKVEDRILTITLNRPGRLNAFTAEMGTELMDAIDRAEADDDVRVIIITGAGRGFCAGADLEEGGSTWNMGGPDDEFDPEEHRDGGGELV